MISIIIPCYNQAEFLGSTLANIQNQTYSDFECIVVDDGSTDESALIVKEFADKDSRFRLVQKANGGSASARNAALRVAKGDYIQFLDSDDIIETDKLERQLSFMLQHQADVSFTDWMYFREREGGAMVYVPHSSVKSKIFVSLHFSMLTRWGVDFSFPPNAMMYRTEYLRQHDLMFSEEIRFREDWDFLLEVSRYKGRFAYMKDYVGAYYRINPHGKTSSASKMAKGNLQYLAYKSTKVGLTDFLCLAYRLSNELILLFGRVAKFLDFSMLGLIGILCLNAKNLFLLLISLFFLPVAVLHVVIRSILEYTLTEQKEASAKA